MIKIIKAKMSDNLAGAYQSCAELTYRDGGSAETATYFIGR